MTDLVSLRAVVRGRVQGVFFRRNCPDGTVEVWAEGERYQLEKLSEYLYVGPPGARVDNVEVAWAAATGSYVGFDVRV